MNPYADHALTNDEIGRYSRQLLVDNLGVAGQEALKSSKVLVVGAGGLGCPVAIYLAAAGVGQIGVVDYDFVERDNLHRQIGHNETRVGRSKADSLKETISDINSDIRCIAYQDRLLDRRTADALIAQYDLVCDCTDNAPSRYMLSDVCVKTGKPLVSGSALRWEGQLTIYNHDNGPCYRCLYPKPPPPTAITNCSEAGVIGAVCGVIGSLQALEAVKLIAKLAPSYAGKLLIFNGLSGDFRSVKLRTKNPTCICCSEESRNLLMEPVDYEKFCGSAACDKVCSLNLLPASDRLSVDALQKRLQEDKPTLIDCRPTNEFQICRLRESCNIPLTDIQRLLTAEDAEQLLLANGVDVREPKNDVLFICHRGNDSQIAVLHLKKLLNAEFDASTSFKDIRGGLDAWSNTIDPAFPKY